MNSQFARLSKETKLYSTGHNLEDHVYFYRGGASALRGRTEFDEVGRRSEMVLRTYVLNKAIFYIKKPLWAEESEELLNDPRSYQKKVVFLVRLAGDKTAFYFTDKSLIRQISSVKVADLLSDGIRAPSPNYTSNITSGISGLLN